MLRSLSRIISGEPTNTERPRVGVRLSAYRDVNNRIKPLRVGQKVTLGVVTRGEIDWIMGVVIRWRLRPMIDYMNNQIIINMTNGHLFVPTSYEGIPYGDIALVTIRGRVTAAPEDENQPAPPPVTVTSRAQVQPQ